MTKKIILILSAFVVVLLALMIWLLAAFGGRGAPGPSPYSAVYLRTGDIYFGKLSWFPRPKLREVWLLQRTVDEKNKPQFSVARFADAFWGPIDEVYLNQKEIVFWTRLSGVSEVANAFAARAKGGSESPLSPEQGAPAGNQNVIQ